MSLQSSNWVDLQKFERYHEQYRLNSRLQFELEQRKINYAIAKDILNAIADDPHFTESAFKEALDQLVRSQGQEPLWHSGNLHRHKTQLYPQYLRFQAIIKQIRTEVESGQPIKATFEKGHRLIRGLTGAGVNYLTEILMTYDALNYPNLNKNPLTVLNDIGSADLKTNYASYTGRDYMLFRETLIQVNEHFGMTSFLETDSFFNHIYWL